ncbi:DUF835 domain-containing protein [Pyrococcus kukulkanii]|uniref:DUF835 domain-containing protein n=1 Tax=Pyrococcus kukulkanii TaxID=1609559 RepID=UPI003561A768
MDVLTIVRIITILVRVAGAFWLIRLYRQVGRKSALVLALGLLAYSLHTLSDLLEITLMNEISIAMPSTLFMLMASVITIEEEGEFPSFFTFALFSLTPLILITYTIVVGKIFDSKMLTILGVVYGISGFFTFFSGVIIWRLKEIFGRKMLVLSGSLALIGLHQMDYPFLRPIPWFAPIGFTIATVLTLTLLYGIFVVFRSEVYFRRHPPTMSELKEGSFLVSSDYFNRVIMPKLKEFPVLAFVRDIQCSDAWYKYFVTRAVSNYEEDISPTDLPRMLELSKRYLQASKGGVIVIDCPEYLALYNGFEALLKFLATLRDMVIVHNGTLIVITERGVWEDRQWILLTKILQEKSL